MMWSCISVGIWTCAWWIFFFKQKTAYEMRISDWSSDVCSSDLGGRLVPAGRAVALQTRLGVGDLQHDAGGQLDVERDALVGGDGRLGPIGRASGRERVCQYL